MDDYNLLFREVQHWKQTIKPDLEDKKVVTLPLLLVEIFENETDEKLNEALQQTKYANTVAFTAGRLRFKPEIVKDFIRDDMQGIISHITEIMRSFPEEFLSKIFLVGRGSDSPMLLGAIRELFPKTNVIAPADPFLAVLKGAVLLGHNATN